MRLSPATSAPVVVALVAAVCTMPVGAGSLEDLIGSGELPEHPKAPLSVTPLLNRVRDGNTETSTFLVRRAPHTRTPIHTHGSGGITCLIEGEMTLYVENQKPLRIQTPGCFYMSSGQRMIGYNSGRSVAVFYDTFEGGIGFSHWSVQERGQMGSFGHQFGDDH